MNKNEIKELMYMVLGVFFQFIKNHNFFQPNTLHHSIKSTNDQKFIHILYKYYY